MGGFDSDSDADLLSDLLGNADEEPQGKEQINTAKSLKELDSNNLDNNSKNAKEYKATNTESDAEADLLNDLLANVNEEEEEKEAIKPTKSLKELGFNFLDSSTNSAQANKPTDTGSKSIVHDENLDSSDDEDRRNFEEQKYSDYGRDIKSLLSNNTVTKDESKPFYKSKTSKGFDFNGAAKTSTNKATTATAPKDVYSDPFFGLRIISPLISSAELKIRMTGKTPVTLSRVKYYLSSGKSDTDWVIAGILVSKSPPKTSQKGSSYSIWKLTDLSEDMNTVCLFMFSSAYKSLWKTTIGTVIGILNPNIMESRENTDQATLSIDNAQRVMLLGQSKDMGKCKSMKKNGEPCTSIVNISRCEYCVFHVKQEYQKCSRRAELQSSSSTFGFSMDMLKKKAQKQQPAMNNMPAFTPVFAVKNQKMAAKDAERLALLSGSKSLPGKQKLGNSEEPKKNKAFSVELTGQQMKKDLERLNKLKGGNQTVDISLSSRFGTSFPTLSNPLNQDIASNKITSLSSPSSFAPRLGAGCLGGTIDFSQPISKKHIDRAKVNALKWVRENGKIKRQNPNKVRVDKEEIIETGKKRAREEESNEEQDTKKCNTMSDKFKEMLEAKSAHTDLIEKSDKAEEEKYFNKLELKERMEEKMLTTFKVPCKAVRCLICKYTAFSGSDICKEQKHPLRVMDAVKRFFKCGDCGNRTVSLDRIPSYSCTKCSSSNWTRAAMMDERKTKVPVATLSVRGGEEKFLGSTTQDSNLNLLVPESD